MPAGRPKQTGQYADSQKRGKAPAEKYASLLDNYSCTDANVGSYNIVKTVVDSHSHVQTLVDSHNPVKTQMDK